MGVGGVIDDAALPLSLLLLKALSNSRCYGAEKERGGICMFSANSIGQYHIYACEQIYLAIIMLCPARHP